MNVMTSAKATAAYRRLRVLRGKCPHVHAVTKTYVGSTETYQFCPKCWETFGGEETPAKKALIQAAAEAEERYGVTVEDPES